MSVYPVRGTLVLSPTNATTGGTELPGVLETVLQVDFKQPARRFRTGVGADSGVKMIQGRVKSATLTFEPRSGVANFIKLLAPHLTTDGTTLRPWGGTANKQFTALPVFAMVVRPSATSENYIYSPAWALTDEGGSIVNYADLVPKLETSSLTLVACANTAGVEYVYGSAADINTEYSL